MGDLEAALDPATRGKVAGRLQKDLTKTPVADLAGHLTHLGDV
jgi:hypothetical protein